MEMSKGAKRQRREETKQGGNRAAIFVYATQGLENMAFISIAVSLVTYFYGYMNFGIKKSATTLTNFMGTSFLVALFGGFISDTYLSRFSTCLLFGCIELLGYIVLVIQAHFDQLRPSPCGGLAITNPAQCEPASSSQAGMMFAGLYLVAVGTSGMKAALPALGADQFDSKTTKGAAQMSSFFNWFLLSLTVGAIAGVTVVVWISSNQGWDWGFGLCAIAVLAAVLFVSMGKPLYRNNVPQGSPLVRIVQVIVASVRNRKLPLPDLDHQFHQVHNQDGELLHRTNQFRFLDRAAMEGSGSVCTVTQVEETKILIRMLPIILSTVFMNTCLAQLQTFSIQQSTTMDTHILGFKMPAPSIPVIPLLFMFIFIPIYDRIFVPIARRITGIPTGIRHLQRIGVGLVLSAISMAVAGFVEMKRKHVAEQHGMVDSPLPLPMTVFWVGYQYAIFGLADMFTLVGILEFFYSESSAGMKSLSTAISWCSLAFGYFLSSVVVEVVNKVSGGWIASNNLNRDKLDYFYWLLAGMSVLNFGVYLICSSWYRYKNAAKDDCKGNGVTGESVGP